jgi:hypothetical protein
MAAKAPAIMLTFQVGRKRMEVDQQKWPFEISKSPSSIFCLNFIGYSITKGTEKPQIFRQELPSKI